MGSGACSAARGGTHLSTTLQDRSKRLTRGPFKQRRSSLGAIPRLFRGKDLELPGPAGALLYFRPMLKDLLVIETAGVLAGPAVGMFFAELGAR
ncbi:MAG: hypothetical protein ABIQ75_03225, partial [Flavobacteriales bacterium]